MPPWQYPQASPPTERNLRGQIIEQALLRTLIRTCQFNQTRRMGGARRQRIDANRTAFKVEYPTAHEISHRRLACAVNTEIRGTGDAVPLPCALGLLNLRHRHAKLRVFADWRSQYFPARRSLNLKILPILSTGPERWKGAPLAISSRLTPGLLSQRDRRD